MKAAASQPDSHEKITGKLTDEQFRKITSYLASKYGLRLPLEKKMMFESRFIRRLNSCKLSSFKEYIDYIFSPGSAEYQHFVDLATTHKTFFFREEYQFDFLKNILPFHVSTARSPLNVWSAGCSTGEEVYTLGMILNEFKIEIPGFDYKITGTDISIPSLQTASRGLYTESQMIGLPGHLRDKYFKAKELSGTMVHAFTCPEVTNRIRLGVLNLNSAVYKLPSFFDCIFCRNVIIYFDLETQRRVLEKLVDKLKPGGYLFLGHSETAIGSSLPIRSIRPTIYQKY